MTKHSEPAAPKSNLAPSTEFKFENLPIRTVMQGDVPWFVAKDVCDILGISNPRQAIAPLDDDEKGVILMDTIRGRQKISIVSESGFYDLTRRSDKPAAKRLFKWVTRDVLPQIRKTGEYRRPTGADATVQFIGPDLNDQAIPHTLNLVAAFDNLQLAWRQHHDMLGTIAAITLAADESRAAFTKAVVNDEIAVHCPQCRQRLEGHKILSDDQFDTARLLALKVEEFSIQCNRDYANLDTIRSAFAYTVEQIDAFERAINPTCESPIDPA